MVLYVLVWSWTSMCCIISTAGAAMVETFLDKISLIWGWATGISIRTKERSVVYDMLIGHGALCSSPVICLSAKSIISRLSWDIVLERWIAGSRMSLMDWETVPVWIVFKSRMFLFKRDILLVRRISRFRMSLICWNTPGVGSVIVIFWLLSISSLIFPIWFEN